MNYSGLLNTYSRYPVEFVSGNGPFLYDVNGKEYIDFLCGIAVTGFGHNHPAIKSEVLKQINNFWHVSNLFTSTPQEELAKKLAERSGLNYTFFSNSGTEANEAAIKFARKWGKGRFEIIATENGFHGRTFGSLSATGQPKFWEGYEPLVPGFSHVKFGSIVAIHEKITPNTVAIIVETIQGEGGVNVAPEGYIKALRELCTEKEILLIIDEVQTGIGRTGKFFSYQYENIVPDIVTTAKGIANGLPLGVTICSKEVADEIKPGNHGSTFGGNPVAIAAANKVVDLLDEDQLKEIAQLGTTLQDALHGLNLQQIKNIRGKGLIIGVEFTEGISSKEIALKLLENGFLVGTSGDSVLRILPPFIITQTELMKFLSTFRAIVQEISIK
ncbi:MAG: aspartate aminotransferase family protein [Ignavibacteriaceae bacterium]|nr:aspartate aminotransferase family protein [Ignavibacteriaceae bacterium]